MTLAKNTRNTKTDTSTSESLTPPPPPEIPFPPSADEALRKVLDKLFTLIIIDGNTTAAKILLDIIEKRFDDAHPAFDAADALKLLQEHFRTAD